MDTKDTSILLELNKIAGQDSTVSSLERVVYVRSHQVGERKFLIKVFFDLLFSLFSIDFNN